MDASARQVSTKKSDIERALDKGEGILRFTPAWVPRVFSTPGRRLRLHPADYFPFGPNRGGIVERWLASTIRADNGPATGAYEGMSLAVGAEDGYLPFDEVVATLGADLIGSRLWDQFHAWPVMSKFFDNEQALPLHIHHTDEQAARVHKKGKPEAYYYSPQMNNHLGLHPYTYLGLRVGVTRGDVEAALRGFERGGDNHVTELSVAFRIRVGSGWDVPAGLLHAPGSACTYEPQAASDVLSMFETWSNNREVSSELLWKDQPVAGDYAGLLDIVDWEANTDPELAVNRFMAPVPTRRSRDTEEGDHTEHWVVYKSPAFSAKELTVPPGRSVVVQDRDAYGCIVVQGYGRFGPHAAAAATTIRFGHDTEDEFFVSEGAATAGVTLTNQSATTDLVILKHFGPSNQELADDQ